MWVKGDPDVVLHPANPGFGHPPGKSVIRHTIPTDGQDIMQNMKFYKSSHDSFKIHLDVIMKQFRLQIIEIEMVCEFHIALSENCCYIYTHFSSLWRCDVICCHRSWSKLDRLMNILWYILGAYEDGIYQAFHKMKNPFTCSFEIQIWLLESETHCQRNL